MFSASTESSHPSKSIGASFSPTSKVYEHRKKVIDGDTVERNQIRSQSGSLLEAEPVLVQDKEAVRGNMSFEESLPEIDHVHLERPSSPPMLLKESDPLESPNQEEEFQVDNDSMAAHTTIPEATEDLCGVTLPIQPDMTGNKPWSVEFLMREAIRHYHSNSTHVDIQTAAHLLQKLHILFQDCDSILPYEECDMIFQTYNEQLLRQSMYLEAAELRHLCVPSYPSVYDYAQMDTFINVFCFKCKRPYENPKQDNRRCHRCDTPQDPCAICMSIDPPPEWVAEHSESLARIEDSEGVTEATSQLLSSGSSTRTEPIPPSEMQRLDKPYLNSFTAPRPKGSSLWTWCQGCGHGGHMACIVTWLNDVSMSEGGCATPGCMHDCGPGPRREQNRATMLEESKRRDPVSRRAGAGFARRDRWDMTESNAAEKARGMLGIGPGIPADGVTSSGTISPKKVRLVTPSEQGTRRPGTTRVSLGGTIEQGGRDRLT